MELLYWFEAIRTPILDGFFSAITYLGSELVFMVLALAIYWCVSKSRGLYLLSVGCLGTTLNQFLKITCRIPRPWVRDPSFTIVESARADATGYSFPSGHTQNAVGTFGCLAADSKRSWLRAVWIVLAALVAVSRMYLGVHTPMDVGVAAVMAVVLVIALRPLFRDADCRPERMVVLLIVLTLLNGAFLVYAACWPFPADADPVQLAHGVENAAKLTGALIGMTIGYCLDWKKVHSDTAAPLAGQLLKLLLGLALLLAIKSGLKPILGSSIGANALRYGLMTFFAAGIWPMTFPWFAKIGTKRA